MASLTANITLSSTGLTSSPLSIAKAPSLAVAGDFVIRRTALSTTSKVIAAAAEYTSAFIWVYNTDTAIHMSLGSNNAADVALLTVDFDLQNGEWAFFPWNSTVDLHALSASGTPKLEYAIFERA